ncbi:hypothetical protein NDU88_010798 [Pleurodeles waltl]|uniref:Uncharacterized protein n=1 Tax=Pleurodeles waltl TaxID=8319 RepID=A0AAV7PZ34_PLEWA|nr:hypothetical protein NDU88_010798 [Pleurodeles waltl]
MRLGHPGKKRRRALGRQAGCHRQDGVDDGGRLRTLLLGGVGFAPPDAAAWEEQRPGPSGIRTKSRGVSAVCVVCGGCGAHDARGTVAPEEAESDVSLKEGELRNSGSEAEWWERKGRGDSNPVRKSFQVAEHLFGRPGGHQKERAGGEVRTVQERPPLLSPEIRFKSRVVKVCFKSDESAFFLG